MSADDISGIAQRDDDALPSQVQDRHWIQYTNTVAGQNRIATGYWMLRYNQEDLDAAWTRAKALCKAGQLQGVERMQASTALENEKDSNFAIGAILMYAGSEEQAEETQAVGRIIVEQMQYKNMPSMFWWPEQKTSGRPAPFGVSTQP